MMLTTKGRYAVMAMVDLAMHSHDNAPVALAEICKRQDITVAYLEQIFARLKAGGVVQSSRGPGGGYRLSRHASHITVADVIIAVDEPMKMTRCESDDSHGCMTNRARCVTHELWEGLGHQIQDYLTGATLEDVMHRRVPGAKQCGTQVIEKFAVEGAV